MLVRAFLGRHRSLARVRAADYRPVSQLLLGRRGHGDPGDRERFRPLAHGLAEVRLPDAHTFVAFFCFLFKAF